MKYLFLLLTILISPVKAFYAIDTPWIINCPQEDSGEMTVVLTDRPTNPWVVTKWNCTISGKLLSKNVLEKVVNENPPKSGDPKKWDEKCPSGTIGTFRYIEKNNRRFIESWTCTINGTLISFEELKKSIENKITKEGSEGLKQTKNCPPPYQGSYDVLFINNKWTLQHWTCSSNDKKVDKQIMDILIKP